jgi:hypothetical protein
VPATSSVARRRAGPTSPTARAIREGSGSSGSRM